MFTVVIHYTHPEDGLQEQDSWRVETLEEAIASADAAHNLDCYINPVATIYDANNNLIEAD
jgi:hypothetical protein